VSISGDALECLSASNTRRHDKQDRHFLNLHDLDRFDFATRPSIDKAPIRDPAAGRWIADGDVLLLLRPRVPAERISPSPLAARHPRGLFGAVHRRLVAVRGF
jgi:hypothetical protein